ncbi:uncharacterized protein J7T54_000888 [Emericellopsis cladophorae]|uniref:Uncharacterized protein n=1 Tax=Emericellopsis cladophorae TaxID=2686198 RepID=A0A9P9Y441_9HYPO|nr:uncharacterized protein J7T54_000888 [Emericellopsis cladophorae]KAI6782745.1 hypothetical protein J7T54_000888 [Emericellopsis cladophorae]
MANEELAWDLFVYGWRDGHARPQRFSSASESGAGVVTAKGQLIGIVLAANSALDFDGTYFTPYEAIEKDFLDHGLSVVLR